MIDLKRLTLSAYYYASCPYRRWANARADRAGRAPVMILFYHRVADKHPNDWTISSEMFLRQIMWIRERFEIVSLEEAQNRIRSDHNERPTVSITFDDGYAENCFSALPWLVREQVPFTYFVTLDNMQRGESFPHDIRLGLSLKPNSVEQIQALANAGVEIGAHTRTHPDLGQIDHPDLMYDEVVRSRDELQKIIGKPVRYFAFPYGMPENMNCLAFRIAYEAGFAGVCSAYGGYNFAGDDAFHLRRFHADPEMLRMKNWLTRDPRKQAIDHYTCDYALPDVVSDDSVKTGATQ